MVAWRGWSTVWVESSGTSRVKNTLIASGECYRHGNIRSLTVYKVHLFVSIYTFAGGRPRRKMTSAKPRAVRTNRPSSPCPNCSPVMKSISGFPFGGGQFFLPGRNEQGRAAARHLGCGPSIREVLSQGLIPCPAGVPGRRKSPTTGQARLSESVFPLVVVYRPGVGTG